MHVRANEWHPAGNVSEQAPGVFFVEGPASNWIVVRDETGFMLIDSGYPADRPLVLESIRHVGLRPADARAVTVRVGGPPLAHGAQQRRRPRLGTHQDGRLRRP